MPLEIVNERDELDHCLLENMADDQTFILPRGQRANKENPRPYAVLYQDKPNKQTKCFDLKNLCRQNFSYSQKLEGVIVDLEVHVRNHGANDGSDTNT